MVFIPVGLITDKVDDCFVFFWPFSFLIPFVACLYCVGFIPPEFLSYRFLDLITFS